MTRLLRDERGMALALAIVALVIVGALVAGALFSGTQEERMGENSRRAQEAFSIAEEGAYAVVRKWTDSALTFDALKTYPVDSYPIDSTTAGAGSGKYSGKIYKLNNEIFLVDVTGQDNQSLTGNIRGGGASQRIGLLATIKPLQIDVQASLTSGRGNVTVGNSVIDGTDHLPSGWSGCPPPDSTKAGIRVDSGFTVSSSGSSMIIGNPPVKTDSRVNDSTFSVFGDVTYTQLASRANVVMPGGNTWTGIDPVVTNNVCDRTQMTNWGDGVDAGQPCSSYFPIIHIQGDATITGDQGQGILLVDGSLTIQGSFQFFGITIIQGKLNTAGGGNADAHFYGAVMAHDSVQVGNNQIAGNATINYSRCAILKALDATGLIAIMRSRGWVQLF